MRNRYWFQIIFPFLLFAAVGTVGLTMLLNSAFQHLSRDEFVALANSNAEFIRDSNLPGTERLAGYLSQLLGMEVYFDRVAVTDPQRESASVDVRPGLELTLVRERPTLKSVLSRPLSIATLIVFWSLWFALAWAVAIPFLQSQRLAVLGGIATSLAHEIRNPVNAIRLHGQLLQEQPQPDSARLIVSEAGRIEDMVNQWMFLARPSPPFLADFPVGDLLRQTARLLEPAAEHAKVKMVVDSDDDWRIKADRQRLEQVFHNIILNAIQAMPRGGILAMTARDGIIGFADTGGGFSANALRRWKELLYSEKEGGMGVGLTVAESIIRAHGGRLVVANGRNGGALVRIAL
jgi:signal transduction histidine kinase